MQDYFLVLDTETSGLPKKWDVPFDAKNNWPHVLQIAWIIFDKAGNQVKKENHYLKPGKFNITKASLKVHKLDKEFLMHHGKDRKSVFKKFSADIRKYHPLIIAHFVELDYNMVGAEYYRLGLSNPLQKSNLFCTLKASAPYVKNPALEFLKLGVFYKTLFKKKPTQLHNALVDAQLTAEIFFHLLNKNEVNSKLISSHTHATRRETAPIKNWRNWYFAVILIVLVILFALYLYGR